MIFARLFRADLITGEHTIQVGHSVIGRGDLEHLHSLATQACGRHPEASAYRLYEGPSLREGKALSLTHVVKQK